MTGAMYAAIGGLKSHMTKLNVIGNNLANVNTYGYKAQRMTFRESIYGTNKAGSNGSSIMGGNNPSQIGYGCSIGSIDLNMSPSTYSPTGFGLDCMLTGEGFFMVGDKIDYQVIEDTSTNPPTKTIIGHGIQKASDLTIPELTRVGDFWVDADGYICNRDNKVLYGFARVQNPNYNPNATDEEKEAAKNAKIDIENPTIISTELVPLRVPLSAAAPTKENGGIVTVTEEVPDGKGGTTKVTSTRNLWEEGDPVYPYLNANYENRYASPDDKAAVVDPDFDKDNTDGNPDNVSGAAAAGSTQIPVGRNDNENSVSDVLPVQMRSMQVGKDGAITGTVNGKTVVIGYIAVASADSPDGVTNMGGPYYKAMGGAGNLRCNALVDLPFPYLGNQKLIQVGDYKLDGTQYKEGDPEVGTPRAADRIVMDSTNSIQNGGLEASSTDVATEFAEMITAQRGYQVNTRIVSVTDSMLEELANMKR